MFAVVVEGELICRVVLVFILDTFVFWSLAQRIFGEEGGKGPVFGILRGDGENKRRGDVRRFIQPVGHKPF